MKVFGALLVLLTGCAGAGAYIPVLEHVLELATKAAAAHGANLKDVPMTCEQEYDPKTRKLLILCEADLSSAHRSPQ